MGKLEEFLLSGELEPAETLTDTVQIKRFPEPFTIRAITQAENKALKKSAQKTVINKRTHQKEIETDTDAYVSKLVIACTVDPNFRSADLQARFGVMGAEALVEKLLAPGEYGTLVDAIQTLNGFDEDINDKVDEAKN